MMELFSLDSLLQGLEKLSQEICFKRCFQGEKFEAGLVLFRPVPTEGRDSKQINHPDKDLVCHVLKGRGILRIRGEVIEVKAGSLCHIPKNTPHDFSAKDEELLIFYITITQG